MEPKNWPKAFQYSPTCVCRDLNENLLQHYLQTQGAQLLLRKKAIEIHPDIEIQKITYEFTYNGTLPHPLAGQDVFEGHAQHGVFAKGKIAKGTILGAYVGEIFLTKERISDSLFKQAGIYCWHLFLRGIWLYIYSRKIANELTFVNDFHGLGQEPNVQGKWLQNQGYYFFGYETTKEIEPMQEILIDYQSKKLHHHA